MINKNNAFDNTERVNALLEFGILDTEAEKEFNEIVEFASKICDKPVSLISLLDKNRQWFKAKVGLDVDETPIDIAFCKHALEVDHVFIVEDATKDDRFKNNPLVTGYPDIKFYAGTQLQTADGYNVGTLCVIDSKPGQLNEDQLEALQILGRQVMKQMELKRALKIEKEYAKKIEQQHQELEHLLLFKDKIFTLLSHDLRGPIGGINQILLLLENEDISLEEFKELVPTFSQQIKDTSGILDNLLSWASKQSTPALPQKNTMLVEDLIFDAIRVCKLDAEKKGINIIVDACSPSLSIVADKEAITIVLRNLIKNSIKYCKANDTITIGCNNINEAFLFKVVDTGVGIDKETKEKLFNPKIHFTSYGTANEKGTGLGLLICKNIIEQNGGKIWAESELGKGASFYFTIPA